MGTLHAQLRALQAAIPKIIAFSPNTQESRSARLPRLQLASTPPPLLTTELFYQGHFWNLLSNRLLLRVDITMNQLGVNTACPQDIATAKPRRTERSARPPSGPVSIPHITPAPALCLLQEKPSCSLSNGALLRSGLEVLF